MNDALELFLHTDPRDGGCAEAFPLLDVYVDIAAAGGDPAPVYPGIAAHLAACEPCNEDFEGLLAAVLAEP